MLEPSALPIIYEQLRQACIAAKARGLHIHGGRFGLRHGYGDDRALYPDGGAVCPIGALLLGASMAVEDEQIASLSLLHRAVIILDHTITAEQVWSIIYGFDDYGSTDDVLPASHALAAELRAIGKALAQEFAS